MTQLTNPLATAAQLYDRSSLSSLPQELIEGLFIHTQCLTQTAGLLLELPQSVTAQANVLLARYWVLESVMADELSDISAAAIYLAAKMGPLPRSPRDVALVYHSLKPRDTDKDAHLTDGEYAAFQRRLLHCESRILAALSFDTHVALPHPLLITYLQTLDFLGQPKEVISRRATAYLNTALLSPQLLYVTHQPHALATAALYSAARDVAAKMPECEWWEVFDVDRETLGFLVVAMRSVDGWLRKRRAEWPLLEAGIVTKKAVEDELRRRGMVVDGGAQVSEEEEMMRMMDVKGA